jgi:geranylgeranyl transferase type-2 subunit alpha
MPIPRTRASELAYTTRKIEASFSNFSAWHQRSKVLPLMWAAGELDETRSREEGKSESCAERKAAAHLPS